MAPVENPLTSVVDQRAPFALTRDRDAWATIRGFVYQVDLSILRWLDLGPLDRLVLEHGEDIDLIAGLMVGAPTEHARLLEQIKVRERSVTLRTAAVRGALANFVEHSLANPTLQLAFRFTTTASAGREQKSRMPGGLRGIEGWELVRKGQLEPKQAEEVLMALRALLLEGSRPDDVPDDQWIRYHGWLTAAPDKEFRDFVQAVEWFTFAPDPASLRREVHERALARGLALTLAEAQTVHERLFAAVFTRLCTPGLKQLTHAGLLPTVGQPGAAQQELIARLRQVHNELSGRVQALERRTEHVEGVVAAAAERIQVLAERAEVITNLTPAARSLPVIDEPLASSHDSDRSATVDSVLFDAARPVLVSLVGAQFSGKTQLARLVARALGERRAWVRLHGASPPLAAEHLSRCVHSLKSRGATSLVLPADWAGEVTAVAAKADVLVLDDVPRCRDGDPLGQRLLPLLRECLACGVSVVLTSMLPLPWLDRVAMAGTVRTIATPPLAASEVRDVLASYGASPSDLTSQLLAVVAGVTSAHPVLLHAVAQHLAARGWTLTESILSELFNTEYAGAVNRETAYALLEGVTAPTTRDLLYRLTTTGPHFTTEEMQVLAAVPPLIERRQERFMTLVGPWIQEDVTGRYTLSPLVQTLGNDNLPEATRRGCHRALARRLLSGRDLDAWQIAHTVTHFVAAGEPDSAGLVLLQALHSLFSRGSAGPTPPTDAVERILSLWRDTALPTDMSAPIRLQIRAYHAVLALGFGKPSRSFLEEVDALLVDGSVDPASALFASGLITVTFALSDARVATRFMGRAVTNWELIKGSEDQRSILGAPNSAKTPRSDADAAPPDPVDLALLCIGGVQSDEDLDAWLTAVEHLPIHIQRRFFVWGEAREPLTRLATRLVMSTYETSDHHAGWVHTASRLHALAARADAINALAVAHAARAVRITSLLKAGEAPAAVIRHAEELYAEYRPTDPDSAFLVARHLGMSLLDLGFIDPALEWLTRADSTPGTYHRADRGHVKMRLAQHLIERAPNLAAEAAEGAVHIATGRADSPRDCTGVLEVVEAVSLPSQDPSVAWSSVSSGEDVLLLQALGERALVRWALGQRIEAARAMVDALSQLLATRNDASETWRWAAVVMGHSSGYLMSMLTAGSTPEDVAAPTNDDKDRREPYAEPRPGLFAALHLPAGQMFRPDSIPLLATHAALLAEVAGDLVAAAVWAGRAVNLAKQSGQWTAAIVPLGLLTHCAVMDGDFAGAITHATDAAAAYWVQHEEISAHPPGDIFAVSAGPDGLGARVEGGPDDWRDVDALVLGLAILPSFFVVADAWLTEGDTWRTRMQALYLACQLQADYAPGAIAWDAAVEVCDAWERILSGTSNPDTIRETNSRLALNKDLQALEVAMILGQSMSESIAPVQALYSQLGVGQYLHGRFGADEYFFSRLILRVLETYWRRVFEHARFRFSAPALVEARLVVLGATPTAMRMQKLFDIVATGLGVPIPGRAKSWVYGVE